jgi:hypothetical protein
VFDVSDGSAAAAPPRMEPRSLTPPELATSVTDVVMVCLTVLA